MSFSRRGLTAVLALAFLITVATASPGQAYKGATHQHEQWVKYTILEQFGVTATEVYIRMQYYQNSTYTYSARYDYGRCYHSSFPGWTTKKCTYWLTHASSYEGIDIQGWFHNSCCNIDYQQHAWTRAYNDDSAVRKCYLDFGALPYLWSGQCAGGRRNV